MTTSSNVDVIRLWQLPDDFFALDLDLSVVVNYALILFFAAQAMTLVGLRRLRHMDLVERSKSFGQ